ncbi:MAG: Uncharacterised protein [Flavobacterium sp. SCGC AAA160-P02]|nr:MAG: Uncharacterised protein [Flavobacterium sp. SCGC AAA160-P02]
MGVLDSKHKKKSAGITLLVLMLILWGIFNIGLNYLDPPPEYGIAINYGTKNFGSGETEVTTVKKVPAEQVKEEVIIEEAYTKASKDASKEDVIVQTPKDAPVIETSKEEKKDSPKKVSPTEDPKPIPKKPSENTIKAFDNLLKGDTSDGKPTGEGDDDKEANKGNKKGVLNASKYYGNSAQGGDRNYNLAGRNALSKPIEQPNCEEEGTVVVSVEVDNNGRVLKAVPGMKGTTNSAECLLKPARKAALNTTWNADPNAPSVQRGTIIYKFSLTQ